MSKNIFIVLTAILLAFLQSSFYTNNIRVNLIFILFIYLLFFDDVNSAILSIFAGGIILDLFSMNFGAYFFGFFTMGIILYYIYRNVLSGDRFFSLISLNFIGIIVFNFIFYLFNIFSKFFDKSIYIFNLGFVFREFIFELIFTFIVSVIIYFLINLLSKKTRDRLTIIGN